MSADAEAFRCMDGEGAVCGECDDCSPRENAQQTVSRCEFWIEREWPGHSTAVLSRRQCRNRVRGPFHYCHVHRYKEKLRTESA